MTPAELIEHWRFRIHRVQLAHYECARQFEHRHLWLGLPAIALSSIVGTTVFASISRTADVGVQIGVGILSVLAALLTGLQTFLRYSELSEKHRVAGARFANLKHRIELLSTLPPDVDADLRSQLSEIEATWSSLREESPSIPRRIWAPIEKAVVYGQPLYVGGLGTVLPDAKSP